MKLVTETAAYRELVERQIDALNLRPGHTLIDLGSGLGTVARSLTRIARQLSDARVIEIDLVPDALRESASLAQGLASLSVVRIAADLGRTEGVGGALPLKIGVADRVVASLLINYLPDPSYFLQSVFQALRPGGLFVGSVLRRDADTSKICVNGVQELRSGRALQSFGEEGEKVVEASLHSFINEAAKLIDLEEQGVFRFWEKAEVVEMVSSCGFDEVRAIPAFGDPPQAWLITSVRPE